MKKIILAIMLICCASSAVTAQVTADTTITKSCRSVIIEMPDGETVVEVTDSTATTTRYPIRQSNTSVVRINKRVDVESNINVGLGHTSRWNVHCGGFSAGFVAALNHPEDMPVEMGKSWEFAWTEIIGIGFKASRTTELRLGFGIDWRNYKISTPDRCFTFDDAGNVTTAPYPDIATHPVNSRLKIFNLQLPFAIKQKMPFRLFRQQQWLAVGITLDFSPHASMLTRYATAEGNKVKISSDKIGQRRWSYELTGILGVSEKVGVYVRYQPLSVLSSPQPDFGSLSTGLILFY